MKPRRGARKESGDSSPGSARSETASPAGAYGTARVLIRKGQLLLAGAQPLVPSDDGSFMLDESAPDRVRFEAITGGKGMRMNFSGIIFRRVFTP